MSTIDIGIAEMPARITARTDAIARPTRLAPVNTRLHSSAMLPLASSDFYVGSIKIDALAPTRSTAA